MKNLNTGSSPAGNIGCYAYIDESGNEGFSETSGDWFMLNAFLVDKDHHLNVMQSIDKIKQTIQFQNLQDELHFRKLQHDKKKAVTGYLSKLPFISVAVIAYKPAFTEAEKQSLAEFPRFYFFMVKCLLERISWFARDRKMRVEVTFSNRAHVSYGLLEHYIFKVLKSEDTNHTIDFNSLGPVRVVQNHQRKLLQASDVVVSSLHNALQKNVYGDVETAYAKKIIDKFWRRNNKLYSYGIKLFPSNKQGEIKRSNEFFSLLPGEN